MQDLISIFNDSELELLVCGLPEIDTDDLRANTEYTGYSASSPVVQYFWEVRCRHLHASPHRSPLTEQLRHCTASRGSQPAHARISSHHPSLLPGVAASDKETRP